MATRKNRPPHPDPVPAEYGQRLRITLRCTTCSKHYNESYSLAQLAAHDEARFCPAHCTPIPDDRYQNLQQAAREFLAALHAVESFKSAVSVEMDKRWTVAEVFAPDPVAKAKALARLQTQFGLSKAEIKALTGTATDQVTAARRLITPEYSEAREYLGRLGRATIKRIVEMCGNPKKELHIALKAAHEAKKGHGAHAAQVRAARSAIEALATVRKQREGR